MAQDTKVRNTLSMPEEIWALVELIGKHEMWNKSTTVQEIVKYYAREKGFSVPKKEVENDHEND